MEAFFPFSQIGWSHFQISPVSPVCHVTYWGISIFKSFLTLTEPPHFIDLLRRVRTVTSMASSSRSCNSASLARISKSKRCKHGYLMLLTSHSRDNPNRRFWRCPNWPMKKDEDKCREFKWEDETSSEDDGEVVKPHLHKRPNVNDVRHVSDLSHSCQLCDVRERKLGKVQKKLANERSKVSTLVAVCVVSWAVTFAICIFSMFGGHWEGKKMG